MNFNEIIRKPGRQVKTEVYYLIDGERKDIGSDKVKGAKIGFNTPLIGTIIKFANLELLEEIPVGAEIYLEITARYDEHSALKIFGAYYLKDKASYDASNKTFNHTCYDEMLLYMSDYVMIDMEYPCTISEYFNKLCMSIGLENNVTSLVNGSKQMASDIYADIGYTFRDVLDDIAQANGICFAINDKSIMEAIRIEIDYPVIINDDILKNSNIDFGKHFGPINTIVLSRSADSDSIYYPAILPENPKELKISDNQLMNGENREEFMPGLYEKLSGIEFDVFDTELVGFGGFGPLQQVKFETGGNEYNSFVYNWEVNLSDGWNETIYTEEPPETVSNYKVMDSTEKNVKKAYIIADKANATINAVVENIGEDGEVTGASLLMAINGDESETTLISDKIKLEGYTTINGGFSVDGNGNATMNNATINGGVINVRSDYNFMTLESADGNRKQYYKGTGIIIESLNGNGRIEVGFTVMNGKDVPTIRLNYGGKQTTIQPNLFYTPQLWADNIQFGECTLNSNGETYVGFNTEFEAGAPYVLITPITTASGVISPKVRAVDSLGFTAIIGGSGFTGIKCNWIAIL